MSVFTSLLPTLIADIQTVVSVLPHAIDGVTELIVKLTTLVAAVSALLLTWRNGRKTDGLKVMVDGRLSELLQRTKTSEHAKGMLQGTAEGLAEGRSEGVGIAARRSADRDEGHATAVAEGKDRAEGRTAGIAEGKQHQFAQEAAIIEQGKK